MQAYDLYLPTHIVFGKGRIKELGQLLAPYGKKVLLTYGGGSIKKIGLYDQVKEQLQGFEVFEHNGIEPNPKIDNIREAVKLCKKENIDVILAVGGGSVLDASKNISAGTYYDGDPWDLVLDSSKIGKCVPIVSVLTLAATGSEYDNSGVISNPATNEKLFLYNAGLNPKVSILDPEYTYTVSAYQTAAGSVDIISHTLEQYMVLDGNMVSDAIDETIIKTVMKYCPIAIKEPDNYEARAHLMLAASFGCNGLLAIGRGSSPWVCHGIEHEISAYTDITHGVGLGIITPQWMRYSLNETTAPRFAQYAANVFGLDKNQDLMTLARLGIEKTEQFFRSIGIPAKLSEVGVTAEHFEAMADHILEHWMPIETAIRPLDKKGILEILNNAL